MPLTEEEREKIMEEEKLRKNIRNQKSKKFLPIIIIIAILTPFIGSYIHYTFQDYKEKVGCGMLLNAKHSIEKNGGKFTFNDQLSSVCTYYQRLFYKVKD